MEEDKTQQFVGKVCQKAIIVKEDKIFVTRGVHGETVWEFPGGRMHLGESAKEGLEREIREELGLEITRGVAVYADRYYHLREPNMPHFGIFYLCKVVDESVMQINEKEVREHAWLTREELQALPMYDDCRAAADAYLKM